MKSRSAVQFENSEKLRSFTTYLITAAAVVVTVISQFFEFDLILIYGVLWTMIAALCLKRSGAEVVLSTRVQTFLISYALFGILCMLFFLYSGQQGYVGNLFLCLSKVMLVYVVGVSLASAKINGRRMLMLAYIYIASAVIYAIWIQFNYMPGLQSWLSSEVYIFGQKNSFGQIASVAIVLSVIISKKSKTSRILCALAAIYLYGMVAAVQCRSAMICCTVAIGLWAVVTKKYKFLGMIGILGLAALVFVPQLQSIARHAFLIDKYQGASLDTFSSGRLGLWNDAFEVIGSNPLIGVGDYYVDNFYLNSVANVGLFAGSLLILIVLTRIVFSIKAMIALRSNSSANGPSLVSELSCLAGVLAFFYLLETLFEALPPIGLGTCSFVFWIICGYLDEMAAKDGFRLGKESRFGRCK